MDDQFEKTVFVLTSNTFQKWYLAQGDPERLVYSCDIETLAKKAFALNTWVSLLTQFCRNLFGHSKVLQRSKTLLYDEFEGSR